MEKCVGCGKMFPEREMFGALCETCFDAEVVKRLRGANAKGLAPAYDRRIRAEELLGDDDIQIPDDLETFSLHATVIG